VCGLALFCCYKFHKILIIKFFEHVEEKIRVNLQIIKVFFYPKPKNLLSSSKKYRLDPGSGKNFSGIQDLDPGVKKHLNPDPQHCYVLHSRYLSCKVFIQRGLQLGCAQSSISPIFDRRFKTFKQ
jgi:hypothetical protein